MEASFLEVYNDALRDLLLPPNKASKLAIKQDNKDGSNEVVGLSSGKQKITNPKSDFTIISYLRDLVPVTSPERVFELLKRATKNRCVASTSMNDQSSRSHSIFQLKLLGENSISGETVSGLLNLIDLAGSEKLSQSKASGQTKTEAIHINRSLTTLGNVIAAIGMPVHTFLFCLTFLEANGDPHIPYRESKLTRVLQNSLGGNSKTLMFVNVSPCGEHIKETLRYFLPSPRILTR